MSFNFLVTSTAFLNPFYLIIPSLSVAVRLTTNLVASESDAPIGLLPPGLWLELPPEGCFVYELDDEIYCIKC